MHMAHQVFPIPLAGIGMAFVNIPANVIVHQYHRKHRTLASSIGTTGYSVGCLVPPVFLRWSVQEYGWRGTLMILAAIEAQCIVAAMLFLRNPDLKHQNFEEFSEEDRSEITANEKLDPSGSLLEVLSESNTDDSSVVTKQQSKFKCLEAKKWSSMRLLSKPAFLLFLMAYPLSDYGADSHYTFSMQRAIFQGIGAIQAAFVVSITASFALIGRIVSGVIGNSRCANWLFVSSALIILCALATVASIFADGSLVAHLVCASVFGFGFGKLLINLHLQISKDYIVIHA